MLCVRLLFENKEHVSEIIPQCGFKSGDLQLRLGVSRQLIDVFRETLRSRAAAREACCIGAAKRTFVQFHSVREIPRSGRRIGQRCPCAICVARNIERLTNWLVANGFASRTHTERGRT